MPNVPAMRPPLEVRVQLEGVEPPMAGLRVQVFEEAVGPRLAIENFTDGTVEILDDDGRAFLRVSRTAVQADLHAHWWHRSVVPRGAPPNALVPQSTVARWRTVRAQNAWSWFDPRLEPLLPDLQRRNWSVPARIDGRTVAIVGRFVRTPGSAGALVARLTSSPELMPRLRVVLTPGRPPALLLENGGDEPVVVVGAADEPFMRIAADGVDANLASPTWQDLCRARGQADAAEPAGSAPRWSRVSLAPRYRWLEPRAAVSSLTLPEESRPPDNTRSKVKGWQVPLLAGQRLLLIQGVVEWVPARAEPGQEHPAG